MIQKTLYHASVGNVGARSDGTAARGTAEHRHSPHSIRDLAGHTPVHENQSRSSEGNGPGGFLIGKFVGQNSIGQGLRDQRLAGLQDLLSQSSELLQSIGDALDSVRSVLRSPRSRALPRARRRSPAVTNRHQMSIPPLCTVFVLRLAAHPPSKRWAAISCQALTFRGQPCT